MKNNTEIKIASILISVVLVLALTVSVFGQAATYVAKVTGEKTLELKLNDPIVVKTNVYVSVEDFIKLFGDFESLEKADLKSKDGKVYIGVAAAEQLGYYTTVNGETIEINYDPNGNMIKLDDGVIKVNAPAREYIEFFKSYFDNSKNAKGFSAERTVPQGQSTQEIKGVMKIVAGSGNIITVGNREIKLPDGQNFVYLRDTGKTKFDFPHGQPSSQSNPKIDKMILKHEFNDIKGNVDNYSVTVHFITAEYYDSYSVSMKNGELVFDLIQD